MQQLTGRFADLNTSNMLVGEFAVPNDHNPVVKMDNGKIREIPLLSDMDSYEDKIQEVNNAMTKLNNEYESTKNQLVAATKANADSAAKSAAAAATSETNANTYKNNAASSATAAASSASSASTYKDNAKTYMDNANAYAKEAKTAASSITGALKPKGTVTFAKLPTLSTVEAGAMYNISTAFTSNANFKDGGNITYPAGTNVYKTEDGMWDCLAGELSDYLMKDDIDTAVEESMPDYTASTQLTELVSGEKLSTALGKIKTAVKNVISLVKLLGTTDISKIGNGTVTGAISSLNSNIVDKISKTEFAPVLEYRMMTSDANFNDCSVSGIYVSGATQSQPNAPLSPDNGYLFVTTITGIRQIWISTYQMVNRTRYYKNGQWSSWVDFG